MAIYFAFSDECGVYKKERNQIFLSGHPFYARANLIIRAEDWKRLNSLNTINRNTIGFPPEKEIKWSYLWSLSRYKGKDAIVPSDKDFSFLNNYDYDEVLNYYQKTLGLLDQVDFAKIIITVTDNSLRTNLIESKLLTFHLQDGLQRIEMEIQKSVENLCVLFMDPISEEKNKILQNFYNDLFRNGDFIKKYSHIKDSLNFEQSHHSVGIQLTDHIAGCFLGFMRNFDTSKAWFYKYIYPHLRSDPVNGILGYGIREIPSSKKFREKLEAKIEYPF